MILAIESGTTRTRAWALADGSVVGRAVGQVGARDVARAHDREWLLERVRQLADDALAAANADWGALEAVVAFGMITSELGLEELPHLGAPVGVRELADGMQERDWGDWLPAPLFLVPGVRNPEGPLQRADFMRGEETEAVGLLALGHVAPPLLYISTGSHTKFVEVDADGRIAWSVTTLGGELVWALHRETILADLVDPGGALADVTRVEEGADSALEVGLSRTLFAARLLHRVGDETPAACSAFIHGAVAMDDLIGLRRTVGERPLARRVAVAGKSALAEALRHLIRRDDWADELHVVDVPLGALGALALHRARNGGDAEEAERSVHA